MSEREDTKFLVDWVREWVGKMHRDISCEERGRIADEMCCEWSGSGIGASYQEYMIEYNPTLANVPPVARDNAGLLERLRIQAQVIRGDIEVVVNESGETDDYEHSTDGLLDTVEEAADAIESLQKATTRTRERYNLAASRVSELEARVRDLTEALIHSRLAISNAIELFGVHKDDPAHATLAMIDAALSGQPGESA